MPLPADAPRSRVQYGPFGLPIRAVLHCNIGRSALRYRPFGRALCRWRRQGGGARGPWAGLCGIFPRLFDVPPDGCFAFVPCLKRGSTLCPAPCMPLWLAVARRPFGSGVCQSPMSFVVIVPPAYGLFGLKGAYTLCRWLIMFRFQRGVFE